jgi:hypothetical protein
LTTNTIEHYLESLSVFIGFCQTAENKDNVMNFDDIAIIAIFAMLTVLYLRHNPAVLANTQREIALAVLALVVGVAFAIRRKEL